MNVIFVVTFLFFGSQITDALRTPANCGMLRTGRTSTQYFNGTVPTQRGMAIFQSLQQPRYNSPDTWAVGSYVQTYEVGVPWNVDDFSLEIHYNKSIGSVAKVETFAWNKICPKSSPARVSRDLGCNPTFAGHQLNMDREVGQNYFHTDDGHWALVVNVGSQLFGIMRTQPPLVGKTDQVKFVFRADAETCTIDASFGECTVPYPMMKVKPMKPKAPKSPYEPIAEHGQFRSEGWFQCAAGYKLISLKRGAPSKTLCQLPETWKTLYLASCDHGASRTECQFDGTWKDAHLFECERIPEADDVDED